MIKGMLKDRKVGFYISLVGCAIALIGSILYIALDIGDKTFSIYAFILGLISALSFALVLFIRNDILEVVPTILASGAFAFALRAALPSLSDVWNGVNFIGGNAALGVTFTAIYLVSAALGVVSSFMGQNK
jgi:hypothetical protein